ncbi:hypothetical protein ACVSTU_21055 [Yersinia enterocolitica]|uniref:hypothetical protein n=1 Tax=Yersinia enterocolitica TaxID=630 RepID=UPI0037D2459F
MKPSPQCCGFSHKAQPQNLSELKALIESEIADFMAGLGSLGEPTAPTHAARPPATHRRGI